MVTMVIEVVGLSLWVARSLDFPWSALSLSGSRSLRASRSHDDWRSLVRWISARRRNSRMTHEYFVLDLDSEPVIWLLSVPRNGQKFVMQMNTLMIRPRLRLSMYSISFRVCIFRTSDYSLMLVNSLLGGDWRLTLFRASFEYSRLNLDDPRCMRGLISSCTRHWSWAARWQDTCSRHLFSSWEISTDVNRSSPNRRELSSISSNFFQIVFRISASFGLTPWWSSIRNLTKGPLIFDNTPNMESAK